MRPVPPPEFYGAYFLCPKFTSFRNCVDIMSIFNREKTGEGSVFFTAGARKIMMESDDNFVMRTPLSPCRYYGGLTGILGSALSLRRVPLFPALLWKSGTSLKYRNIVSCVSCLLHNHNSLRVLR